MIVGGIFLRMVQTEVNKAKVEIKICQLSVVMYTEKAYTQSVGRHLVSCHDCLWGKGKLSGSSNGMHTDH